MQLKICSSTYWKSFRACFAPCLKPCPATEHYLYVLVLWSEYGKVYDALMFFYGLDIAFTGIFSGFISVAQ